MLTHLSPWWFSGYDVFFELVFTFVSLFLSITAYRVYRITKQKQIMLFASGFLFVSISYLVVSVFNFFILQEIYGKYGPVTKFNSILYYNALGNYTHMVFMVIGLCILVHVTLKAEKDRMLALLLVVTLSGLFMSRYPDYYYLLVSTFFIAYISWHFIKNYISKRGKNSLLVAIAFVFLLLSKVHYLFSVKHLFFYAFGHILEFLAYFMLILNLYMVLDK